MGFNSGFKGLTSVLGRGEWSASCPGCFTTKRRDPPLSKLNRRMDGPQSKCGQVGEEKYLLSWLVQPGD